MRYRRSDIPGATYFFTVSLADRKSQLLVEHVDLLRSAIRQVKQSNPFDVIAMVVMPDHLHAIWRLPEGDANFPLRWSLIKAAFSRALPKVEIVPDSRRKKRERGIWQRRYWEHQIRDDDDLEKHVAYIHFNPVKHGYVEKAADWPYSSIHREIMLGNLDAGWAFLEDVNIAE
ncbi:REP-associated tyrosine transposase [Undibacterium sp. TJN25]|uniref:REP-associated tyrosine transposase n=1 Tax=Undibacterium sp. TJN25 TaxID=3413056 RepID=UPI003BF30834